MPRPATPLFSILSACYNARVYLPATYASLVGQTVSDWEWIVADDGSTDGSAEYLEELSQSDPRVIVLRVPRAGRPAPARNAALREARGEFIALLDADDLFLPTKLERQYEALLANPDAASYHDLESFWSEEIENPTGHLTAWQREDLPEATFEELLVRGDFVPTSSLAMRRVLVTPESFMDEAPELRGMEDYDFVLRFSRSHRLIRLPEVLGRYRVHSNSLWSSTNQAPMERLRKFEGVRAMMERQGHLRHPAGRRYLIKYHLLHGETLLWHGRPGWRWDFALTVCYEPTNPRRLIGLLGACLPKGAARSLYFGLRRRMTGLEPRDPMAR